ncbi:putative root hair defective 3 GTP-binding protein [Gregarina niphandrodes]|uniref:Protein SEY1 homolog n=1 Tax=Gregarina niphandrodes TaxID=110365 RepID=A0A023AY55_GRENI|nr:putative root hair defective 3 GTP-binding protein [Gregarina niphandrodes]EZG43587.1 putative root hair defective 3 GTP-binding protein [Gregarina niphandrodes]|eukprot:XP_011133179.1 putative root hair defective 3 GTP-binding protein [Gregarina niphandrodes]
MVRLVGGAQDREKIRSMSEVSRSLVEVVDFDGVFHSDFKTMFDGLGLLDCGLEYNVVTVLGCQSSGKSTLLNALFGTKFPEMDSMCGRGQTTRGVWCSRDIESSTLVIDVEGTDSKERGEDRLTFEHRASLFSLAVADAVIVNMWYHDIGRYTASNYGLLKTVLAVMLELFHTNDSSKMDSRMDSRMDNHTRTHMIFIIRDHSSSLTPIHKLERLLLQDVVDIWDGIKKPLPLQNSTADDFFKFSVIGLPSKVDDKNNFDIEVKNLKLNWLNKLRPKHYTRTIPADGFPMYCESIWNTIMNSDQLDIPSQKEMVAIYRCDEIKIRAFMKMKDGLAQHDYDVIFDHDKNKDNLTVGDNLTINDNTNTIIQNLLSFVIHDYHKDAWRYDTNVYNKKLNELLDDCYYELQKIYDTSLNMERQKCLKEAAKYLEKLGRKDPYKSSRLLDDGSDIFEFWRQLDIKYLSNWMDMTLDDFAKKCKSSSINFSVSLGENDVKLNHEFTSDLQMSLLKENLIEMRTKFKESELQSFKNILEEPVQGIREQIEMLQLEPDLNNYWNEATKILLDNSTRLYPQYGVALQGIVGSNHGTDKCEEPSREIVESTMTRASTPFMTTESDERMRFNMVLYECLRESFARRSDRICDQVYKRFKRFFETDEDGVPNYWATTKPDDIKRLYREAKSKALALFPIICEYKVDLHALVHDEFVDPRLLELSQQPLLFGIKQSESLSTSEKFMLKACQEAQFIQATGGQMTKQSWWMWLLCILLGWNEIMFVIRQPIIFMLGLTAALVMGAAWYTGNLFTLITGGRLLTSHVLSVILPIIQKELAPKLHTQTR